MHPQGLAGERVGRGTAADVRRDDAVERVCALPCHALPCHSGHVERQVLDGWQGSDEARQSSPSEENEAGRPLEKCGRLVEAIATF